MADHPPGSNYKLSHCSNVHLIGAVITAAAGITFALQGSLIKGVSFQLQDFGRILFFVTTSAGEEW